MMMTNAEWLIKSGYDFYGLDIMQEDKGTYTIWHCTDELDVIESNDSQFGALLAWLDQEHKEQILDDVEKRYLSGIIKPFRDKIKSIEKSRNWAKTSDRIYFHVKNDDMFYLPNFKVGAMYKGMKPDKEYTLEELGL